MRETRYIRDNHAGYNSIEDLIEDGVKAGYNRSYLKSAYHDIQRTKDPISFAKTTIGLTETELREKYDNKLIITKAAAALSKGVFIPDAPLKV